MKWIILTGTSRGLGKALFDHLLNRDVHLYCISRRFLLNQEDFARKNNSIRLIKIDLSKPEELFSNQEIFKKLPTQEISELIFINNAGIIEPIDKVGNLNDNIIYESLNVNYFAPIFLTNNLLKTGLTHNLLIKILNITTGAANRPFEGWSMYCSTKAAYKFFLEVLSVENEKNEKIKIFNIDPGKIDTDMQQKIRETDPKKFPLQPYFVQVKEEGDLASPEEVAKNIIEKYV